MGSTVLAHLILFAGLCTWNNIPGVAPASTDPKLRKKASEQDIFHMCDNRNKTCVDGVQACANYSYSVKLKHVVCCLECNGPTELIQTDNDDPCDPNPCGEHGKCKAKNATSFKCKCTDKYEGELCADPPLYQKAKARNCSRARCHRPNKCVPVEAVGTMITAKLRKQNLDDSSLQAQVLANERKADQLKEIIISTRSGRGDVCFCSRGRRGMQCDLKCKAGTWGFYCLDKCDENCVKPKCGPKDGKCKCKSGYIQSNTGVCVLQRATKANCQKYCKHGTCEGENCTCNYAKGPYCDTKCSKIKPHPRYGKTCEEPCGGCTKLPCNPQNGACPRSRPRCLESYFTSDRCELERGVIAEAQMTLAKVDDSVSDDEFTATLARIEKDQKKVSRLEENIRTALVLSLGSGIAITGSAVASAVGVSATPFMAAAAVTLLFTGSTLLRWPFNISLPKMPRNRKLLQLDEPSIIVNIKLPMPPGGNSSTYKHAMKTIMSKIAEDFQTDLIPGLGVKKESIRVINVRAIELEKSSDVNSEPDNIPLVVGGVLVAAVAIAAVVFALIIFKKKPSRNTNGTFLWRTLRSSSSMAQRRRRVRHT